MEVQPDKKPTELSDIPVEIFEYIIHHIVDMLDNDGGALFSCTQVCRSWYHVTLRFNCRYLIIKPGECQRFCELMDGNPLISHFTREIIFMEHSYDDEKPNVDPWVNDTLKMFEGRLPNIEAMMFMSMHETGEISTVELFANLAKYTGVKRLEMVGCSAPFPLIFAYICAFPNLETLNLKGIYDLPHEPNRFKLKLDYPKPSLKALRIRDVPYFKWVLLGWLTDSPSMDTLEWVVIEVTGWVPGLAEKFLRNLGPALTNLDIQICKGTGSKKNGEEEEFTPVNLQDYKYLKTLTLQTAVCEGTPPMLADLQSKALRYLRFSVPPYRNSHHKHYKTLASALDKVRFPSSFEGIQFICEGEYEKMGIKREKLGRIFQKFSLRYPISFIHSGDVKRFWFIY